MIGVYQIECNGKLYVGSTSVSFEQRWRCHMSDLKRDKHHSLYLQRAFKKYGKEALVFSILEIIDIPDEVIVAEQKWIDLIHPEYNMCPVAGGHGMSERAKELLRQRATGNQYCLGRIISEETREKLRKFNLGNKNCVGQHPSEETKEKIRRSRTGIYHTDEAKQKMSAARRGKKFSEEHKTNLSLSQKGKKCPQRSHPVSEETRQKLSQAKTTYWAKKMRRN